MGKSLLFLGGWCCYSKETCDSRYQNIPRLMSSSGWAQTKKGWTGNHVFACMTHMFSLCYFLLWERSNQWLHLLQEVEYCPLKQRKTHTGITQTLCKYLNLCIFYYPAPLFLFLYMFASQSFQSSILTIRAFSVTCLYSHLCRACTNNVPVITWTHRILSSPANG